MWVVLGLFLGALAILVFEYRIRRPDRIVVFESKGQVKVRSSRFYPRHFSLAIPAALHSLSPEIEAESKGKLDVRIRLAVTVAPSLENLPELIRVAGWSEDAVIRSAGELDVMLQAIVRDFSGRDKIEDLTAERLSEKLSEKLGTSIPSLGLDLISVHVQSIDPIDEEIAEAVRRRETDRIIEETESASQKARVGAARAKMEADEKIAQYEHGLTLKRLDLKKKEEEKEAGLARRRIEEEMKLRLIKLDVDKAEIELIKNNPELVLLTPQAARLAEASQGLRNAKTVVSLSGSDLTEGSPVAGILHSLLQRFGQGDYKKDPEEKDQDKKVKKNK